MSVYIIAEVGSNHCMEITHTKHLIQLAANAGANAVKFQLWDADKMFRPETSNYAAARRYQLPREWIPELKATCDAEKVDFLCTAFDFDSLDFIDPYVKAHKVASIEATWLPFLDRVNEKRKPVLLSVGAMEDAEVWKSVLRLNDCPTTILQCVVSYPARIEDYNLRTLKTLRAESRVVIEGSARVYSFNAGVSDHTTDPLTVPMAATALGATVIEKHIKGLFCDSPDAPHAISDREFGNMVRGVRNVEKVLGSGEKVIQECEKEFLRYRRGPQGLRGA